ncbi:MAG TPA: hypothetical protein VGK00_10005 [Anaerolineales bacterium]|jgi:hypothetical protein
MLEEKYGIEYQESEYEVRHTPEVEPKKGITTTQQTAQSGIKQPPAASNTSTQKITDEELQKLRIETEQKR